MRKLAGRAAAVVVLCAFAAIPGHADATLSPIKPGEKLTLHAAIEITLSTHPLRFEAEAQADAAREQVGEAESALLPQIYGAAEYLGSTDNGIGDTSYLNPGFVPRIPGNDGDAPAGSGQSMAIGSNYFSGISAYQYLFDFGFVRGRIDQKIDDAAAARARLRLMELNLAFNTTRRFFGVLATRQLVRIFAKAVVQRREQLHAAQVKAKAGLTSEIDVYTARAALERARTHLLDARNNVAKAKVALNTAMGLGPGVPPYRIVAPPGVQQISGSPQTYFAEALKLRPDIQMLVNEARAAGAKIVEYRSEYFPTVEATAGYNAMGTGLPAANNYDVGLVITWPIFNGFLTEHQVAEARLRQQAISDAIEALRHQIFYEVKTAFLDWQTALERIHRAQATLVASRSELELAERRYNIGLGNIIELTDAERFYTQDNATYADALYKFAVARAALYQATGQLLEDGE